MLQWAEARALTEQAETFAGYEGDRPRVLPKDAKIERVEKVARSYRNVLTQICRRIGGSMFTPYILSDAESPVHFCGQNSGFIRRCEQGHEWFTPIGCSTEWCLRCAGARADNRVMCIHRDLCRVGSSLRLARIGRLVLTLHPSHHPHARTRNGSGQVQTRAVEALCRTLGVKRTNLAVFTTFHPTSSKRPWVSFPHIEMCWVHAQLDEDGAKPLPWADKSEGRIIDVDRMREEWQRRYPGSINLQSSWFSWSKKHSDYVERRKGRKPWRLSRYLRYALRPFTEDVWHACDPAPVPRLWAVKGDRFDIDSNLLRANDREGIRVDPSIIREGLESEGGVLLWKGYHRTRRYGWLRAQGFQSRQGALEASLGIPVDSNGPCGCGTCPTCGGVLKVELNESGRASIYHPKLDNINAPVLADGLTYLEMD